MNKILLVSTLVIILISKLSNAAVSVAGGTATTSNLNGIIRYVFRIVYYQLNVY
jgi:hypothetical protein